MSTFVESNTAPEVIATEKPFNVVVQIPDSTTVTIDNTDKISVEVEKSNIIVSSGAQGPQGIQGNSYTYINLLAGQILSGHRLVTTDNNGKLIYADNTVDTHANKVVGIIINAAVVDDVTSVYITGTLTESSWSWDIDLPLYLSTNGQITQVAPITGFSLIIGFAITSTKIFVDLATPIILA